MASAQTRIADTVELFYTAADRTSDGALAANAYKRATEDLDHSITRELARVPFVPPLRRCLLIEYSRTHRTEQRLWNPSASLTHTSQP